MVTEKYFNEMKESMMQKSVDALISEFNKQVGSNAWTSLRGVHDSVLIDTLIAKGIDVSTIYNGVDISFKHKVKLSEDKTRIILA